MLKFDRRGIQMSWRQMACWIQNKRQTYYTRKLCMRVRRYAICVLVALFRILCFHAIVVVVQMELSSGYDAIHVFLFQARRKR